MQKSSCYSHYYFCYDTKKYNKLLTLKIKLNGEKLFCETHE